MERLDEVLLDKTGWDCPFIQESDLFNQQPMLDFPMIYCDHENNGWITAILEGREAVESLINHYLDGDFNESDKWPENSMSPEEIATFKEIGVSMLLDIYIKSDSQKSFDLQAALDWQALFAPLFDGNEPEDISGCGFPVLGDSSACTYINRVEDITFYINYCQAFNQFYSNIPVFSWGNDSDNTKDGAWDWFRELLKIAKDSKQQSLIEYLEAA
jgi:hypothetical protein